MENVNLELPENNHAQEKTSIPHKNQFEILVLEIIVLVILIVLGIIGYWFWTKPTLNTTKQVPNNVNNNSTLVPSSSPKESATVQYIKREKILEAAKYQSNTDLEATSGEDWELDIYYFYKIRIITSLKYHRSFLSFFSIDA